MRIVLGAGAMVLAATASFAQPVTAQQRAAPTAPAAPTDSGMTMTAGAVMRIILIRFNPGMGAEATLDIRRHLLPILEEQKAAGILMNYSVMFNTTTDSPDDWNFGYTLTYPNWAALDSLTARTNPITLRHYGSAEARTAAGVHRAQLATVVLSRLARVQNVSR